MRINEAYTCAPIDASVDLFKFTFCRTVHIYPRHNKTNERTKETKSTAVILFWPFCHSTWHMNIEYAIEAQQATFHLNSISILDAATIANISRWH